MEKRINSEMEQPEISEKRRPTILRWIVVLVILVLVIFACLYGVSKMTKLNILGLDKGNSNLQAVFLSNGQVYFGKASHENDSTVILKDIYYLQVTQGLQNGQAGTDAGAQQELSLVKLGNELHGPVDEMKINRDHILFIEDLKSDGKVAKAIEKYIADQKAQK